VDLEREGEDGEGCEEDEGVDEDELAVGAEAAEVDVELAQQARGEKHEQNHAHHHRTPVHHPHNTS
jgi:hypothetical protein